MKRLREVVLWLERKKLTVVVTLVLIVLVGAGLRFWDLDSNSFVADEFIDLNASYGYAQTGVWQAWDFNQGAPDMIDVYPPRDERSWFYRLQVATFFQYFGVNETVGRSVSALWGLVTIVLMYFVTRSFTGNRIIALLAAFLFAVSITGIEFDRKLRMYAMFYPVYLALSWALFRFLEGKYEGGVTWLRKLSERTGVQPLLIFLLLPLAALSYHLQLLTVNLSPVFFTYVLVMAVLLFRKHRSFSNKYAVFLGLSVLGAVGLWIVAPQMVELFTASLKFFIDNQEYLLRAFRDYSHPLLGLLLLVIGIHFLAVREHRTKEAWWLSLSFFVPLLMAAFLWKRTQGIQYVFFIQSFLIILVSAGIYAVGKFFEENLKHFSKHAFARSLFLVLLFLPQYGYFFSEEDTTYHRGNSEIADYRKALAYVKKHAAKDDLIVTRNFRNFYLKDARLKVYDFGGERADHDVRLSELQALMNEYPSGWVVLFDNDQQFLTKETLSYIKENMQETDVSAIRGAAKAYRW